MKKVFSLMLLLATMFTFTACSSDDDDNSQNSIVGTTWTASYVNELFVIEFESNNKVTGYRADTNMNIKGDVYSGSYSINGNRIILNDFSIVNFYRFYFTDGTINGKSMNLNYWWNMGGERFDDDMTFHQR